MIVLDANVLIAHADPLDASHARAVEVLDHHEWEEFLLSAVTLAEVLTRPTKQGWADDLAAHLQQMGVFVIPVEDDDAAGIAALCAHHRLKTPDAVVLHTARMTSDALVASTRDW